LEQEQAVIPTYSTIEDIQRAMFAQSYIADRSLATAVFLALTQRKSLLLEGEPGVGTVSYIHLTLPMIYPA